MHIDVYNPNIPNCLKIIPSLQKTISTGFPPNELSINWNFLPKKKALHFKKIQPSRVSFYIRQKEKPDKVIVLFVSLKGLWSWRRSPEFQVTLWVSCSQNKNWKTHGCVFLPCDFEDSGVLKRSSFSRKIPSLATLKSSPNITGQNFPVPTQIIFQIIPCSKKILLLDMSGKMKMKNAFISKDPIIWVLNVPRASR